MVVSCESVNGLVRPASANGVPSMARRRPGSTKVSMNTGSVDTNGMPRSIPVTACRLPSGSSSKVIAASTRRMLLTENRAGALSGSGGGGVLGSAARRARMSEKL